MTKTVIEKKVLFEEALTLKEFLEEIEDGGDEPGNDLSVIYVEDEHGNQFGSAKLVEEILTDGSKTYTLVLSQSA